MTERRNRNLHLGAVWRIVPELYRPGMETTEDTASREKEHFLLLDLLQSCDVVIKIDIQSLIKDILSIDKFFKVYF